MVTFHIPQIAPSSGWWVVLFLFFSKAGAHTEVVVMLSPCLSLFPFGVFVVEWRRLETRWWQIDPVADGDAWSEPDWFRPPSVTLLSALLKCAYPNNTFVPESPPCSLPLDTYLLLPAQTQIVTQNINALIRNTLCWKASDRKGKCHLLLICACLPFWPRDMLFSFKATVSNWVQSSLLIEFTRAFIQSESTSPLLTSLFWQFVVLPSVRKLNSAEVVRLCRVALRGVKVSLLKKTSCLWPCLKVTVNLRNWKPHQHKT